MAYLVSAGTINVTPATFGTAFDASTSTVERVASPRDCGLYQRPQGPAALGSFIDVVVAGNYAVVGIPRKPRSEG